MRIYDSLKDVTESLFSIERASRKLATDLQRGNVSKDNVEFRLHDLEQAIWSVEDTLLNTIHAMIQSSIANTAPDLAEKLTKAYEAIRVACDAVESLYHSVVPDIHYEDEINMEIRRPGVDEHLNVLEDYVYRLTGKRCRYRISDRLSSYLNDLASCIHRIAEYMSAIKLERKGKCNIVRDGKGTAFCLTWHKATEKNYDARLYEESDYSNLEGWVVGDKVYLRVGSAEEHRTLVDLGKGTLEYWDRDMPVNKVLKNLLEKFAGLECQVYDYGVSCTGVTDKNMEKVALALSMATSMDFRIHSPQDYWDEEYRELGEEAMSLEWLKELEEEI